MTTEDIRSTEQVGDRLAAALDALESLPEQERVTVLIEGHLQRLIDAIAPQKTATESAYDYLLHHKFGACLLAQLRLNIHLGYSFPGQVDGTQVYVSPCPQQWFEDGVMFLQGRERFMGLYGLYQDGVIKFAIAARAAQKGELLGREDFLFIDVDELKRRPPSSLVAQPARRRAIGELEELLSARTRNESLYQDYFRRYPWVLGAQFRSIDSHEALDDQNIPDFSALRLRDDCRDIVEIKSPFFSLFTSKGKFSAAFNDSWDQAERYLDFCRREQDYLRRQKALPFESPHCYLLLGCELSPPQSQLIKAKERMNPAITVLTYDDVLTLARGTVDFLENLLEPPERERD